MMRDKALVIELKLFMWRRETAVENAVARRVPLARWKDYETRKCRRHPHRQARKMRISSISSGILGKKAVQLSALALRPSDRL